ncbi:SDR family NAD(P)-dependent oxidoreductase [Actinomycetospora sp. TBRC 11914]|uniref:SDR family NAD(P)-dependent oxidoreductase n=1 Tax=Actinomycetospora sp. TBRC 11914 TaxID=2729387 RepID=UPI00145C4774|nr:SDR family oxidoreductase [Actinomycetospora sp. TBRC 11914]NMO88368.1 SDR family oxidoreductase [Actinomycetospora sp. TBRC 11914]
MSATDQKVVIVTGASRGIGAGVVEGYRKHGYAVVATSRSITASDDPQVHTVAGDLADPRTAGRVVDAALERFGRIDTLVNNAGMFLAKPFTAHTDEDFAAMVGLNLGGFFGITRRAVATMLERGSGHVVTVTTSLVDHPLSAVPSVLASLTKGGLDAATRSLAVECAGSGVRANAVSPGIIKTPMHPVEAHAAYAGLHPVGRMGEIDEIVHAVLYLETATFVTGETLHVDGGQCAGH